MQVVICPTAIHFTVVKDLIQKIQSVGQSVSRIAGFIGFS